MSAVSNAGVKARLDALDAAMQFIRTLPGEHYGLRSVIGTAREMLIVSRDVTGAHIVFREVKFELKVAGVENPALVGMMDRARYAP